MNTYPLQLDHALLAMAERTEAKHNPMRDQLAATTMANHLKILQAFQAERIHDFHFTATTGYGLGDEGRDALDRVFARVFKCEAALVRSQIVSGTHAIALCMFGILRPGDELLAVTGTPYDTLEELIGLRGNASGSLRELGVTYRQVDLGEDGRPNLAAIAQAITSATKMVTIQRSRGYAWRQSLDIASIQAIVAAVKQVNPEVICFVDNCYGELVEQQEPTEVGADLVAGSLIKNLGGGLAPTGGYVAGRRELVSMAANRLTAPGIGAAVGASLGLNRIILQGLYLAPAVVREALNGAVFTAGLFAELGFAVSPNYDEYRTDLIQAIKLSSPAALIAFCQGLQKASPIDSHVLPEPSGMPGYGDQVIMAGGTFIQGATSELSADGPLREPYAVYMQGGLSYQYIKIGALFAAQNLINSNLLTV